MNKHKSLTLRIGYDDLMVRTAAYALDSKKANREILRKYILKAIENAISDDQQHMSECQQASSFHA